MKIANMVRIALIGGSAALLTAGLVSSATADGNRSRDENATSVQLVDDDDDGDGDGDTTNLRDHTASTPSAATNDNTLSNFTAVSLDGDLSQGDVNDRSHGDVTRDSTRDGGDLTRDLTEDSTNDRSRNDTR